MSGERWYVVAYDPEADSTADVWTVSQTEEYCGWGTDGGYDCDDKLIIPVTYLELNQHICDLASYHERTQGWNKP